jgi:glucokinase
MSSMIENNAKKPNTQDFTLVGDIGGTKTSLALFSQEHGANVPYFKETFSSTEFESLEEILSKYLTGKKAQIGAATLDIAGPIYEGRTRVTNLPWIIETEKVSEALGNIPVLLLNDLVATAAAIPYLQPSDYKQIKPGNPEKQGAIGIVSIGTGLGEAFLTWSGSRYHAYPSEGGHTSFSPQTTEEQELLALLGKRFDHVSFERVGSGMGLPNIYQFVKETNPTDEPDWLRNELARVNDPTPVIIRSALDQSSTICQKSLEMFVGILGNEAGNLALKIMATAGIFLAGGISPKIQSMFGETFIRRFMQKGRHSTYLEQIPIYLITKAEVTLFGAACVGLTHGWD